MMMSTRLGIPITYLELGRLHWRLEGWYMYRYVMCTSSKVRYIVESPRHVRTTNGNTEVQMPESCYVLKEKSASFIFFILP